MRKATSAFDTAQEQCVTIGQPYGAGIEDTVDRIRPVVPAENGISRVARKKLTIVAWFHCSLFRMVRLRCHSGRMDGTQ